MTITRQHNRECSIEVLRILLMTMIVFHHMLCHGIGDFSLINKYGIFYMYHVNCFVFISSYFGIKYSEKKLFLLLFKIFFYGVMSMTIAYIWRGWIPNISDIRNAFPMSNNGLWFMSCYIFLVCLSPFLNLGMDVFTRKQIKTLIIFIFAFLASGFTFLGSSKNVLGYYSVMPLFVMIYLTGRYIKKYHSCFSLRHSLFIFIGCLAILFLMQKALFRTPFQEIVFWYTNPLLILMSFSFFFIFKNINLKPIDLVNKIASGVLAAYLISDNTFLKGVIEKIIIDFVHANILMMILFSLLFVVIIGLMDYYLSKMLYLCFNRKTS